MNSCKIYYDQYEKRIDANILSESCEENNLYAFYLNKNKKRIATIWYQKSDCCSFYLHDYAFGNSAETPINTGIGQTV